MCRLQRPGNIQQPGGTTDMKMWRLTSLLCLFLICEASAVSLQFTHKIVPFSFLLKQYNSIWLTVLSALFSCFILICKCNNFGITRNPVQSEKHFNTIRDEVEFQNSEFWFCLNFEKQNFSPGLKSELNYFVCSHISNAFAHFVFFLFCHSVPVLFNL